VTEYTEFLSQKVQYDGDDGFAPFDLPSWLFPFQRSLVEWALRKGRAALFADCGLGKTPMQLVWADNVQRRTGKPVLLITPLAVSFQTEAEAQKFRIEAAVSRTGRPTAALTITNYERLHLFDVADFGGVVCDESSAIKAFDGVLRAQVTEFLRQMRYRLLCTATAAPNDYIELGTSSEALGYLGYMDMLSRFFTNDQHFGHGIYSHGVKYRFRGHAETPFWRWIASWARAMRKPSDLGFDDAGFVLPPLTHRQAVVVARQPAAGKLFDLPAVNWQEEREEQRRTLAERCEAVAERLQDADTAIAWCHLNEESAMLTRLLPGAIEVRGSDSPESKEAALIGFARGEIRYLVTKPSIAAWGLNYQRCHRMSYFPSHSYEQYYQAVRRCWRFGQKHEVLVDVITTEGGERALSNLERKAEQASRMFDALVAHMHDALSIQRSTGYQTTAEVPAWLS
jgi:hypothetical protein